MSRTSNESIRKVSVASSIVFHLSRIPLLLSRSDHDRSTTYHLLTHSKSLQTVVLVQAAF